MRDIYGEVIADGHHSHVSALNNFYQLKGRDFAMMVTDSLRAKHCPPEESTSWAAMTSKSLRRDWPT